MKPMKNCLLVVLIIISLINISYSQKANASEKDVFDSKEIVFYGYDFTGFKIADAKRLGQDIRKFMFVWIGYFQDHITEKKLSSWLNKDRITFNFEPTIALNQNLKSEDLGAATRHSIPDDSVQSFINKYRISEKAGIGFVVIVECFDKSSKTASGYFTFFDIATRKILMVEHISSRNGNGYGYIKDWSAAEIIMFKRFLKAYAKKELPYKKHS